MILNIFHWTVEDVGLFFWHMNFWIYLLIFFVFGMILGLIELMLDG